MKYLFYEKETEIRAKVKLIHFQTPPQDIINLEHIETDNLPQDETPEGKSSTLYCNPQTNEVWYEYEDIPKTKEELKIEKIDKKINANIVATRKLIRVDELTEEELMDMIEIYPKWEDMIGQEAKAGEHVRYNGTLYKIIKGLTLLENWKPDQTPSDFTPVFPDNVIPQWVQPSGAHDAYNTGDQVTFEGIVHESTIDDNTWSPTAYPQGWKTV